MSDISQKAYSVDKRLDIAAAGVRTDVTANKPTNYWGHRRVSHHGGSTARDVCEVCYCNSHQHHQRHQFVVAMVAESLISFSVVYRATQYALVCVHRWTHVPIPLLFILRNCNSWCVESEGRGGNALNWKRLARFTRRNPLVSFQHMHASSLRDPVVNVGSLCRIVHEFGSG